MMKDEEWQKQFDEMLEFINSNHRIPLRHLIEVYLMLNFLKHNRKLMNSGAREEERQESFL